jgi:hypothetical protein
MADEYTYRGRLVRFCPRCGRPPLHPSDCARCQKATNALAIQDALVGAGVFRDYQMRGWHVRTGNGWRFVSDRDVVGRGSADPRNGP